MIWRGDLLGQSPFDLCSTPALPSSEAEIGRLDQNETLNIRE